MVSKISKKEVEHIAKLARLELTEKEKAKFEKELSDILGFVEKLNKANTAGVSPLTGGAELANVLRKDEQINQELEDKAQELLAKAPQTKDNWIKVKAIFE